MKYLFYVRKANDPTDYLTGFVQAVVLAENENEAIVLVREETSLPDQLELYAEEVGTTESEVLAMLWSD